MEGFIAHSTSTPIWFTISHGTQTGSKKEKQKRGREMEARESRELKMHTAIETATKEFCLKGKHLSWHRQ